MIIRSGDLRIHTNNLITHNVGKNESDYTINGKRRIKYGIFCNFVGGGYREIVAFKTKNSADVCCNALDVMLDRSSAKWSFIKNMGGYVIIINKKTGYVVHLTDAKMEEMKVVENLMVIDQMHGDEDIIDIDILIEGLGLSGEVI